MNDEKLNQASSLEKMLLKDSQFFKQQADESLQKQIMAAVEREAASESHANPTKPLNMKKTSWWIPGLSTAAIAGFLAVTLMPQLLMQDAEPETIISPQIFAELNIKIIRGNIKAIETASISKITTEKEAVQKDIQSIIDAFSLGKNNA